MKPWPASLAAAGSAPSAHDAPLACEHILASIADAGAGPSYSVRGLATALDALGAQVRLRTLAEWRASSAPPEAEGAIALDSHKQDYARIPLLKALAASRGLERALQRSAGSAEIFHVHGLWLMPNLYPAWAARNAPVKLVVSPRGMLSPEALAFSRLKKAVVWRLFQADALRSADCLHATSEAEYRDVRAAGLRNPVAIIANGVEIPPEAAPRPRSSHRTILSLGRIHPKKGLDQLIRAWAGLEATHPDWRLRIVGPAENGHDRELMALTRRLGLTRVSVERPAFGAEKLALYRASDLFVLPTRNENFAMTVAEALASGVPVISTKGAPWAGLETERCGWWVDHGPEALSAAMAEAMALPGGALSNMGGRGRDWMAREFGWPRLAGEMLSVYRWLSRGAERPACVRLD